MQKDFVDGALGSKEAVSIVPAVCEKIKDFDGSIIATLDTHGDEYMSTREGRFLPVPHCIKGTPGWELVEMAGRKRGYLVSGGEVNTERMSKMLLDEFRGGKLGKFTLEMPEETV